MKTKLILAIILIFIAIWIAGFSMYSFLPQNNPLQAFYPFLKMNYARVCHQTLDKSFEMNGSYFLVCSRCTGIYLGAFVGVLLLTFPIIKNLYSSYKYFFAFSLVLLIDVLVNNFIFTDYNKTTAFFSGYLFSFFTVNFVILELKRNHFFQSMQKHI